MNITKEQYDKLNYREQEAYLKRCPVCQLKSSPFVECCEEEDEDEGI